MTTKAITEPFDPRIFDLILHGPHAMAILPRFTYNCLMCQLRSYVAWQRDQKARRQYGL